MIPFQDLFDSVFEVRVEDMICVEKRLIFNFLYDNKLHCFEGGVFIVGPDENFFKNFDTPISYGQPLVIKVKEALVNRRMLQLYKL
jgi:hypothetical protein